MSWDAFDWSSVAAPFPPIAAATEAIDAVPTTPTRASVRGYFFSIAAFISRSSHPESSLDTTLLLADTGDFLLLADTGDFDAGRGTVGADTDPDPCDLLAPPRR